MRTHLASLVDDFRAHAAETAVVEHRGVRRYATSYGELARLAGRVSAELARRGVAPGERVVLWGANSADWIAAFFGCLLRGVLAVPLDAAGSRAFAARVIAETRPLLIFADGERLALLPEGVERLELGLLNETLTAEPDFAVDPAVKAEAPFQIVFTSGTTSEPKGIVHTHRNVLASLAPIETEIAKYRRYERWFHPLRFLHTLPLSHVFGQFMGLWIPAVLAGELHFVDVLEPGRTIELIRRERISVLIAVPRMLTLLRTHLLVRYPKLAAQIDGAAGWPAWKRWWRFLTVHRLFGLKFWAVISGGASLPAELEMFWNRLGFALIQGYGMTETAALVTLNHPFKIGTGTIGKALPGREVKLSETGELLVRGDMVAGAMWRNGRLEQRDAEWLATGDLAERNEAGEFRFLGRKGEAIVLASGMNVFPKDLEAAMQRQPGVEACAVVACELGNGPEPVCVAIFRGDDAALGRALEAANREMSEFQRMRRVLRWPDAVFPYTSTGKLLKRQVQAWACGVLAGRKGGADGSADALAAIIASVTGEPVPSASANGDSLRLVEDLHLDSLGRVQLASAIEQRLGITIPDAQMAAVETLDQLRGLLGHAGENRVSQAPMRESGEASAQTVKPEVALDAVHREGEHVYPHWPWLWPMQAFRALFLETIARPLMGFFLAPRVVRSKTELPESPMLIVGNHLTSLDGPLILHGLPGRVRRHVAIAMSGEMLLEFRTGKGSGARGGLLGRAGYWLVTAFFNVFPLPRLQGFRRSFAHAGEAIDRGYSVMIFPEGTRGKGKLAPFRQGIGLLAAQARVPVLPVAIVGLERIASHEVNWFRSGRLEIRIGEPVAWPEERDASAWTAELEQKVRDLLSE